MNEYTPIGELIFHHPQDTHDAMIETDPGQGKKKVIFPFLDRGPGPGE
jgi:hypothetical protein